MNAARWSLSKYTNYILPWVTSWHQVCLRNRGCATSHESSPISLSIYCNVKSEFANASSFAISFRYDDRDIIRILISVVQHGSTERVHALRPTWISKPVVQGPKSNTDSWNIFRDTPLNLSVLIIHRTDHSGSSRITLEIWQVERSGRRDEKLQDCGS